MAATRSLMRGDWAKAFHYVSSLSVWDLLPAKAAVLDMMKGKLQEEALRTYLFTYSPQYRSLSLDQLCTMFGMPEKRVYSIVSKMMIAEELHGSWDQPTRTIVMHAVEANAVQSLALQFADKAQLLVELNERAYAYRTGGLRDDDDGGGGGGGGGRRGGRRGGDGQWEDDQGRGRRHGNKLGVLRNVSDMQVSVGMPIGGLCGCIKRQDGVLCLVIIWRANGYGAQGVCIEVGWSCLVIM